MSNSLWPHGLYSQWNSSGQNTGAGSHFLLQPRETEPNPGIEPTFPTLQADSSEPLGKPNTITRKFEFLLSLDTWLALYFCWIVLSESTEDCLLEFPRKSKYSWTLSYSPSYCCYFFFNWDEPLLIHIQYFFFYFLLW